MRATRELKEYEKAKVRVLKASEVAAACCKVTLLAKAQAWLGADVWRFSHASNRATKWAICMSRFAKSLC